MAAWHHELDRELSVILPPTPTSESDNFFGKRGSG